MCFGKRKKEAYLEEIKRKESEEKISNERMLREISKESDMLKNAVGKYIIDLYKANPAPVNKGIVAMELAKDFVRILPSEEVKRLGIAFEGIADVTLID